MSLLQQLSVAAQAASSAQQRAAPSQPDQQQAGADAVQVLLQQLAASIAAIKQQEAQQQLKQDGSTTSNPVQKVQEGLRASSEQLQRLVSCHDRKALPAPHLHHQQQQEEDQQHAGVPDISAARAATRVPSLTVLQHLLQLAVGDSTCRVASNHMQQQLTAGLLSSTTVTQQQQWCKAASEALHLFSFAELEQLPQHSLQQALLLHPQLIDCFLEAAAAAALQPLMSAEQHCGPGGALHNASSSSRDGSASASGGCSRAQSMQSLLAAACPWMQWLPDAMTSNPLLLLKASTTLLSWLEATGHNRLWRLLTATCRPPWQALAAGAGVACDTAAVAAAGVPMAGHAAPCLSSSCSSVCNQSALPQAAGAMQLLCPEAWQQELVCLLCEEPSVLGLLQLLQQLPGIAWPQQQQQECAEAQDAGCSSLPGTDAAADKQHSQEDLTWPGLEEWCQPGWHDAAPSSTTAPEGPAQEAHRRTNQLLTQDTSAVVKVAWGLLVQHHCWYEFACCLLVKGSLQHLRQTAAAQPQQPCSTAALQQVLQLVQLPLRALREQVHELPAAQMAACAAAFIAWVQHPLDPTRQACLHQELLSATDSAITQQLPQGQQCSVLQLATSLISLWGAPAACSARSGVVSHSSPALAMYDLPCALLQQRSLLLEATAEQLAELCLATSDVPMLDKIADTSTRPLDTHKAQQQMQAAGSAKGSAAGGAALPAQAHASVLCQLLDTSNGLCAAALQVVKLSMHNKLLKESQEQQQQQQQAVSWLAQHWLQQDAGCASDKAGAVPEGPVGSVPELAVAKQLLAAATRVDKDLKQRAHGRLS